MKTTILLMATLVIIFTSCSTTKSLTKEQLVSAIAPSDKVGIIMLGITEDHNSKGSSVIGRNSYYYTLPDTAQANSPVKKGGKKAKTKQVLVMDTLIRMVESKYSNYIGTQLVPAKVGTKIPTAGLDAGIPCLPKQTVKQSVNSSDLDKMITVSVGWKIKGGASILGISMGKKKPTAIIITKVYDRSGKKIWQRTQQFDSGLKIKNRGVALGSLSFGGKDGMTGNQLLSLMARALDETFTEEKIKQQGKQDQIAQTKHH